MNRFKFIADVTISVSCEVEAKNEKEARAIAEELPMVGLCHQCASGDPSSEWVTSGELDGSPQNIEALK